MVVRYSDIEINTMIDERKPLPDKYRSRIQLREKRGHKERELEVIGVQGTKYRLILRQSNFNPLDFSVILAVDPPESNRQFRLRRYNGKHGEHTNKIEGNKFYDFHIHHATERYQEYGMDEDAFAEPTDRYGDYNEALRCMLEDCGFETPRGNELTLFGEFEL